MGCERAERENVFIKQQGLWVTPLLWVQCFSCWHRWKFWQQIRPLSALLLMLSKLSAFQRLYCIYNTPQLSRSVLWGVLHIPLTWCKTDPHFSHRDVTWRNRLCSVPGKCFRNAHSRPLYTWKSLLQAVGNVLSPLWPPYACVFQHWRRSNR